MTVEVVHVRADLEAFGARQASRIDARARDHHHAQRRQLLFGQRKCFDDPPQQVRPDACTADRDDANLLVRSVAEFVPQTLPIGELGRIEAGDVAGEVEVLLGPLSGSSADPGRSVRARCRRGSRRTDARSRIRRYRAMCSIISAL